MRHFFYFQRKAKSRGQMWTGYNTPRIWLLDWLQGLAEIIDGLLCVFSLGFIGSDLSYYLAVYKLKFLKPRRLK
jgi:hypothetical protein